MMIGASINKITRGLNVKEEIQNELFESDLTPDMIDKIDTSKMDKDSWPVIILDLHSLIEHEMKNGDGSSLSMMLAITGYLGGMQVYIPKADKVRKELRNIEIWQRFDGTNIHKLAKEYDLAEQHLYRIIAKMRKLEHDQRQPQLF